MAHVFSKLNPIINDKYVGSCSINMVHNKKEIRPHCRWQKGELIIKPDSNGNFIITGRESGLTVIDIDDPKLESNKILMKMMECNNIVKTNKGYHYYYKYTDKLYTTTSEKLKLDIRNDKGIIIIPPSFYEDEEGNQYKYEWEKIGELQEIPEEIIKEIIRMITKSKKEVEKEVSDHINKTIDSKTIKTEKFTKSEENEYELSKVENKDVIFELLDNLNINRAINYQEWIKVLIALKSKNLPYEFAEHFSKRYPEKFDEKVRSYYENLKIKEPNTYSNLWYWLKQDNIDKFYELQQKLIDPKFPEGYEFIDLTKYRKFDINIFLDLFNIDKEIKDIGKSFISNFKNNKEEKEKEKVEPKDKDEIISKFERCNSFRYFNKFHFRIFKTNTIFQIDYESSSRISPLSKYFNESLPQCYFMSYGRKIKFVDKWLESNHQMYNDIIFNPKKNENGFYNLYYGFYYDEEINRRIKNNIKINKKILKPYLNHIKHLVNNDENIFKHFTSWIAHIIQKPWIKQPTCYVFYSRKHGVGKNIMISPIMKIFRGYYFKIDRTDQLVDKFNAESLGKFICYADEIKSFKNGETMSNEIKNIITREEMSVEFKGKDKISNVVDFIHYIFTTNNENNFYIEQTDRRFNMVECTTQVKNSEYFNELAKHTEDEEFIINLYWYFKTLDISEYQNSYNKASISEYKQRLMDKSMSPSIKIIIRYYKEYEKIIRQQTTHPDKKILNKIFGDVKCVSIDDIYDYYEEEIKYKEKIKKISKETMLEELSEEFQAYKIKNEKKEVIGYGFKFGKDIEREKIKKLIKGVKIENAIDDEE